MNKPLYKQYTPTQFIGIGSNAWNKYSQSSNVAKNKNSNHRIIEYIQSIRIPIVEYLPNRYAIKNLA